MRTRYVAALALLACVALPARAQLQLQPRDLSAPGALDELHQQRPDHYERITALVHAIEREECFGSTVSRLLVEVNASDLRCAALLKTSNPPKRRLEVTLDDVSYRLVVTLHGFRGTFMPAVR